MKPKKVFGHHQTHSRWATFDCPKVFWVLRLKSGLYSIGIYCVAFFKILYSPITRRTERVLDDKRLVKKNYTIPKNIEVYD